MKVGSSAIKSQLKEILFVSRKFQQSRHFLGINRKAMDLEAHTLTQAVYSTGLSHLGGTGTSTGELTGRGGLGRLAGSGCTEGLATLSVSGGGGWGAATTRAPKSNDSRMLKCMIFDNSCVGLFQNIPSRSSQIAMREMISRI